MKHFNFWALALVAIVMAACSSEDELTQSPPAPVEEAPQVPIIFSSNKGNTTRAGEITGSAAADLLGKKFVVTGYKGSKSTWAANDNSIVFDNYVVEYAENTAFTTESNVANWEYVGKGLIKPAQDKGITRQTIKYWDYTKAQYDFIAWSTGNKEAIFEGTPTTGQVLVSAITPDKAVGDATTNDNVVAYTFTGASADLKDCYIADMVTVKKEDYAKKDASNPVTLTFRSLGTKVRIGIYETIPGYSVRDVKFYTQGGVLTDLATEIVDKATLFTTSAGEIYTEGTYTVYFPTADNPTSNDNNQAHIKFTGDPAEQSTVVDKWGELNYTIAEEGEKTSGSVYLGRSSNTASFAGDESKNYYVVYLPNEEGTNLNLRVNYTLESIDGSGEIIEVKNAKAQIPLIYTQWKSGFAYTYLFKISDKTDGRTGNYDPTKPDTDPYNSNPDDPAGLYPITFDAMVVNDETKDNTQETITLVSTPSITTYQKGSTVVNDNEYKAATGDIFVTINEGDALVTMTTEDADKNAALYIIPAGKTEAEVVDALQMQDDDAADGTIKGRGGLVLTKASKVDAATDIDAANKYALTNSVEFGVDGNAISVGDKQALRFKPEAGTYAFAYTKTAPTTTEDKYEPQAFDQFATGVKKYRYDYKEAEGTYCQKDVLYFSKSGDEYTKHTAFVGQTVDNLYVKDGDKYVIASGLAVPNTDYYYTTDNGQNYTKAQNVFYDYATGANLYVKNGDTYEKKPAGAPVSGTAYYYSSDNITYTYVVIYPELTTNLYQLDTTKYAEATETAAVDGQTYFDKFTKNNGEYYVKVIKVE